MTRPDVLPSAICTASAPRIGIFRGSMAGLCAPLSTLRRNPRGQLRMTRGRCGSLLLHRKRLALSTPCRSPGASQMSSGLPLKADIAQYSRHVSKGRVEDGRGSLGHSATLRFPSHRVAGGGRPPPVPTERGMRLYRTTLFGSWFTALQAPAASRKGGAV